MAVNDFAPAEVKVRIQEPEATVPVQLFVPSLTVTLPVGVPDPGAVTATAKLTVTDSPTTEGSGRFEVMVVVVSALLTVCEVAGEDELPLKSLLPV